MTVDKDIKTPHVYAGRRRIYSDENEVTDENLLSILNLAASDHDVNRAEISYLYGYYRGVQDIIHREKKVRPEINNKIVENRANEIVSFKTGYLMGEPVQYVSRTDDERIAKQISRLNEFTFAEDKAASDKELADWMHICGLGHRICVPDTDSTVDTDASINGSPFKLYTLDPRYTFIVYRRDPARTPLMGVCFTEKQTEGRVYTIYTKAMCYTVKSGQIVKKVPHILGQIPIVEYDANTARLGAFEIVLPLLDALNKIDSNRMDDVEQTVQAILLLHNVQIGDDDFDALREKGALKYKDIDAALKGEVKYITAQLNQNETQTFTNHLYDTILTICGMPNRNGGTSTSDTGSAVIMRDGWSAAEARAKDTELMFKRAEKKILNLILFICKNAGSFGEGDNEPIDLNLSDIEIRFTRRNYENITEKSNVLIGMLNNDKIAPRLAFTHSGLFVDPEQAYQMSEEYKREREKKAMEIIARQEKTGAKEDNAGDGSGAASGNNTDTGEGLDGGNQAKEG